MAVNLSPIGGVAGQFFTNNGTPLSGGKIYTYAAGSSTPATTYTTAAGNVAHTNPIVLDSGGRVPSGEIWLTDGVSYKFVIKTSADVLIGTYDNIIGINSNFVNYTNSQEIQTATAGQTLFTLTGMAYAPGTNSLSVFVDGVNQYGPGAQYAYVETSSTEVTFVNGLHVGAEVKFTTSQLNSSSAGDASQISFTGFKGQVGNVQDLAGDDGSDWIGFLQAGTNAVAISAQDKMRQTVSVTDFGAVGDGSDQTTEIQNAINFACATNRSVFFPNGAYRISSPLTLPALTGYSTHGCNLIGEFGRGPEGAVGLSARLVADTALGTSAMLYMEGGSYGRVSNIAFTGRGSGYPNTTYTTAIHMNQGNTRLYVDNCEFANMDVVVKTGTDNATPDLTDDKFTLYQCEIRFSTIVFDINNTESYGAKLVDSQVYGCGVLYNANPSSTHSDNVVASFAAVDCPLIDVAVSVLNLANSFNRLGVITLSGCIFEPTADYMPTLLVQTGSDGGLPTNVNVERCHFRYYGTTAMTNVKWIDSKSLGTISLIANKIEIPKPIIYVDTVVGNAICQPLHRERNIWYNRPVVRLSTSNLTFAREVALHEFYLYNTAKSNSDVSPSGTTAISEAVLYVNGRVICWDDMLQGTVNAGSLVLSADGSSAPKRVSVAGSYGSLVGITGSGTSGTNALTVNSNAGMYIGMYIDIAGSGAQYIISDINGTAITVVPNLDISPSGAAITVRAPTLV